MDEITCPYCEHSYDLCHDDGAFYNREGELEKEECPECGKTFMVQSTMSWDFEGFKADCLNGGEHKWKQQSGYPREYFHGRFICEDCGEEDRRDEDGRKIAIQKYRDEIDGMHK